MERNPARVYLPPVLARTQYRLYRGVSSLRHFVARRVTPIGALVCVAALLSGGMATDTEQSLGYQAFTFTACLLLLGMMTTPWFRVRFEARRELPRFGTAGQWVSYRMRLRNGTRKRQQDLALFDELTNPRPTFAEFVDASRALQKRSSFRLAASPVPLGRAVLKPVAVPPLLPGAEGEVEMRILPRRRGVLHFSRVSVARTDPFGLFRAFDRVKVPGVLTVLPKRYALPQIALPGAPRYQQGGVAFASSVGESEEFVSLRDYRPGDPLRHMHWRSWAKVGRPVVREFQDEFFVRHALILDTFADHEHLPVFEEAVSLAASFASTVDTHETLLDLLFIGAQAFCFTIGRGVAHADQMLEILASVQPAEKPSFTALEQIVMEHASEVSGAICILLGWNAPRQQLVRKLSELGLPLLVMVVREPGAPPLERSTLASSSARIHVLEAGNIPAGLAML